MDEEAREHMAQRAEEANAEALGIYEELQHPELGGMYKVRREGCTR
jgi:hypothetical protein